MTEFFQTNSIIDSRNTSSRPQSKALSPQKDLEFFKDYDFEDQIPTNSQHLPLPNTSNAIESNKSPRHISSLIAQSSLSVESRQDAKNLRSLSRRQLRSTSRQSEGFEEYNSKRTRPISGLSSGRALSRENRLSHKGGTSPMNLSYGQHNISRSIGKQEDVSMDMQSSSFSGLQQLHNLYYDAQGNISINGSSRISSAGQRKRRLNNRVKDTYYKLLKKRFGRQSAYFSQEPEEFDEQIRLINDNVRIPNNERIVNLKLEDKSSLERLEGYKDNYPMLRYRKKVIIAAKRISLFCNGIISYPLFDFFILIVIVINSIFLAFDDPTLNETNYQDTANEVFLAIYTFEMILKISGLGFILNKHSYLRDSWNVLDFGIVVSAYLPWVISDQSVNLRAFRALRVLRPLKTLSNIESLRIIVVTLLAALKPLIETLFILFFFFLIFAIAGLQLFSGTLKKRCFSLEMGIPRYPTGPDGSNGGDNYCNSDNDCKNINGIIYICGKMIANPSYGVMSFDNILSALLMTFQTVTLEGWSNINEALRLTFSPFAVIYFVILIFVGAFFLLNLTLAVVKAEFTANSHVSIGSRRVKKVTYDERLIQKLDDQKLDVIRLMKKREKGETLYNKYWFKNDQLLAIEKSKEATIAKSSPRKKGAEVIRSEFDQPGFLFVRALLKLRTLVANNFNLRSSGRSTVLPESRNEIPSIAELGSENVAAPRPAKSKFAKSWAKVYPFGQGSREDLVEGDLSDNSNSDNQIPTMTTEKPISISSMKNLPLRLNQKANTIAKQFQELASESTPPQSLLCIQDVPESQDNIKSDIPFIHSPKQEKQPSSDAANTHVYRQPRGFNDLKIKITEPVPLPQATNLTPESIKASQKAGQIFTFYNKGQANNFFPAAIPSIIEEEDGSEISPTKSPGSGRYMKQTGLHTWYKKHTGSEIKPVRPLMSEKVKMGGSEADSNAVEIINIAGIRNKTQTKPQNKKPKRVHFPLIEEQGYKKEDVEIPGEAEVMDLMDDEQWFLDAIKDQEEGVAEDVGKNKQHEVLLKKINQIKGLTISQRTNLLRLQKSIIESEKNTSMKDSRKVSSALVSEDFEGNFTKNSSGHSKANKSLQSGTVFDDSDFVDKKRKSQKSPNTLHPRRPGLGGNSNRGDKAALKRGLIKKKYRNPNTEIKEENEQEEEGDKQKGQDGTDPNKQLATLMTEEDVLEIEEEEKHLVIDLRRLKVQPIREKHFYSNSYNDVLGPQIAREKQKVQDEENRKIRENKIPIVYSLTRAEETAILLRKEQEQKELAKKFTSLAIRQSKEALQFKRQQMEDKRLDEEVDAALGGLRGTMSDKGGSMRSKTIAFGKSKHKWRASLTRRLDHASSKVSNETRTTQQKKMKGEDPQLTERKKEEVVEEEDLTEEQQRDYFAILRRMQTPFNNEKEYENSEEFKKRVRIFEFADEFRNIRRKDLEDNRVYATNWSGNTVLLSSYSDMPIERVKLSLNIQDFDIWRPGVLGAVHGLRRKARQLIESDIFNGFIMISVLLNTMILATTGLITDNRTNTALSGLNTFFTIVFCLEMGIKVFGLGPLTYTRDNMNLFDAAVVIITIVEAIVVQEKNNAVSALRAVRLFRIMRILRVTKLLRSLAYMRVIIGVIIRSIKRFIYVLAVLLLLIFIFALLGMQIFGGQLNVENNQGSDRLRESFDTFSSSFIAVFQIMTQENWPEFLFLFFRSSVSKFLYLPYLICWIFIGNYIFLNLFLALLLDEFTSDDAEEDLEDIDADDKQEREEKLDVNSYDKSIRSQKGSSRANSHLSDSSRSITLTGTDFDEDRNIEEAFVMFRGVHCAKSLFVFSKLNIFRRFCYVVVKHRYFEKCILAVIFLSSIKLALDTYISDNKSRMYRISVIFDQVFAGIFAVEALMKIVSFGFVLDKNSYTRDAWNVFDLIIVIASLADATIESFHFAFIKVLRLFRTLRPLRFISNNKSMRLIVSALLESVGGILNVLIVVLIIWLIFAILAVNIVGGEYGYCSGLPPEMNYYGINYIQCIKMGYTWANFHANFDNVFQGMLSLFIISTQEDWPNMMYMMMDANTSDQGPIQGNKAVLAYFYFVVSIFVCSFFLINLFIGVIFFNFVRAQKRDNDRHKFLTPQQRKWVAVQRLVLATKPDLTVVEPRRRWMKFFFRVITSNYFEYTIMTTIVLNIVTMAINYDDSSIEYNNALVYLNYFFTAIFAIEMILKHLGLGFKKYWSSNWNRFDGFVVCASFIDIIFQAVHVNSVAFLRIGPQIARIFRVLRISRLFRLIKRFSGLRRIISTLIFSLPSLMNVTALLFLVFFIYAILGNFLFKDVIAGSIIDGYYNFQNFISALIILFRCSTGEDWWYIMFDTIYPQLCTDGGTSCGSQAGIVFWISYIVICQFIFLNLFILIVLQQFEEYYLNPNNPVNKFREKLETEFNPTWQRFSAKHGGTKLHEKQLTPFFMSLNHPLGFRNADLNKKEIALEITQMHLSTDSAGMVFYNDVLYSAMRRIYGNEDLVGAPKYLIKEEVRVRRKLDQLKKKLALKRSESTIQSALSGKHLTVNPIFTMLFMGMTMKAWIKYSNRSGEKMKAAEANGFEYIPSESDEDDYEYVDSDIDNSSSSGTHGQEDNEDHEQRDDNDDQHGEDERISEEESGDGQSEDGKYDVERRHLSRQTINSEDEEEEKKDNREEVEFQVKDLRKQPSERDEYKWIIHKERGSSSSPSPLGGYPQDYIPSSERDLVSRKVKVDNYLTAFTASPLKSEQVESVWGGSPERLSAMNVIRFEGGNLAESSKSIYDFWDAEKISVMSPGSARNSVDNHQEDLNMAPFGPDKSPMFINSNALSVIRAIPVKDKSDAQFLAPPLVREASGSHLGSARVNTLQVNTNEAQIKSERSLLNIPISHSRKVSKSGKEVYDEDKLTPKGSPQNYMRFGM